MTDESVGGAVRRQRNGVQKNQKVLFWSTYTTVLEPILSKIPDFRKPAASRRKAAACLAEKLPYLLKEKIGARKIKK